MSYSNITLTSKNSDAKFLIEKIDFDPRRKNAKNIFEQWDGNN